MKKGIKHIFFLAREGKFLKHLFDLYREKQGYQNEQYINTSYLYVSRRSVFIASLKKIKNELCEIDFTKKITDLSNSFEFSSLIKSMSFQEIYEKKRKKQRKNLLNYFMRMKLSNPIYLVDIGWAGVMQDCIYQLYQKKRQVVGFYYGFECYDNHQFLR